MHGKGRVFILRTDAAPHPLPSPCDGARRRDAAALIFGHAHHELVGAGPRHLEPLSDRQRQRPAIGLAREQKHAVPGTFDRERQTPHHARPSAERNGHALPHYPREIDDHDREGFGLGEPQSDARQRRQWWAHDEQPRKLYPCGRDARSVQGARRIDESAPGGVTPPSARLCLGLGARRQTERGADRTLTRRTQLDHAAALQAAVRQQPVELGNAERQPLNRPLSRAGKADPRLRKSRGKLLEEVRRKSHVLNIVAAAKKGSQERSVGPSDRTINVRLQPVLHGAKWAGLLAKRVMVEDNLVRVALPLTPSRRLAARALALATALLGASRAQAAESEPDIPPECGSRADFDRELVRRLGADAPTHSVELSITQAASRYRLRVQIADEVRELEDASCTELFRASVVVAVAMLLHEPAQSEAAPVPPPPRKPVPPREYPRFSVGAGAGVALGTLPHPVLALELEGKAYWQYLGVSANLRYFAPTEKRDARDKSVELQALGAGVAGIFRPSRHWEARLGFAAQRLSGRGGGSITQSHADTVWAAGPTLGLGFVPVQHGSFWAGLGAEGQLNALRGSFQILHYSQDVTEPPREIYPVPWIAGAAFVRLGLVW